MTSIEAVQIVRVGLSLAALWVVYMAWRWYRVEALRDDLFAIRDRLFDFAAAGGVKFTDPAYRRLWLVLNALIHGAGAVTFARFVLPNMIAPVVKEDLSGYIEWRKSLNRLSAPTREKLHAIHADIAMAIVCHLIRRTIPLMPLRAFVWVLRALGREIPRVKNRCVKWLEARVPALEDQAICAEQHRARWRRRESAAIAA